MRPISAFSKEAVEEYAKANFAKGSRVLSDGLGCWNGLDDAGMKHEPRVTVRIPTHRGHRFRSIADSIPMIADSW